MSLTDIEKERIQQKIDWEGGLREYIEYGIATKLYVLFKDEFDNLNEKIIKLEDLLKNKDSTYLEQEWGFPKGRRKNKENNFQHDKWAYNYYYNIEKNNMSLLESLINVLF